MSLEETITSFASNLDDVEAALEPLLARPLQDTLNDLSGPAERAKLLFWIAYAVHSCSWMYTKLKAVDPEEHGVMDELKRIQGYNGKILAVTKSDTAKKAEERNTRIDKGAADRFIKAAISNQPKAPDASSSFYTASATVQDPLNGNGEGPGPHSRLSTFKRQEEASSGSSSSEEEDLVVEDGDLADQNEEKPKSAKKEGKKRKWDTDGVEVVEEESPASKKATAVPKDPLQGYAPETSKKAKKEKKKKDKKVPALQQVSEAESSAAPSPAGSLPSAVNSPVSGSKDAAENEHGDGTSGKQKRSKKNKRDKKATQ